MRISVFRSGCGENRIVSTEDADFRSQKLGAIAPVDAFLTQLRNLDQAAVALRCVRLE